LAGWQLTVNILTDAVYVESETSLAFESFPELGGTIYTARLLKQMKTLDCESSGMGATENINRNLNFLDDCPTTNSIDLTDEQFFQLCQVNENLRFVCNVLLAHHYATGERRETEWW